MATGNTICLPEPLEDGDAKTWFRWFNVCAAANEWNAAKKLARLPTLLRGRVWAIYELLGEDDNESYNALKGTIINRPNPDTDKDHLAAREQLTRRHFWEGGESIDELARDIEKFLDQSSPGLPAEVRALIIPFNECTAWKSGPPTEIVTQRNLCTNNCQGQGSHPDISEGWSDPSNKPSQGSSRVESTRQDGGNPEDNDRTVSSNKS